MRVGRRKFLRALGASPFAAKIAADQIIAEQTGARAFGAIPMTLSESGMPIADSAGRTISERPWVKALRFFKSGALPDWKLRNLRDEAMVVYSLEPDIAAKKSWSMSVKIQEQRERNYQRLVEQTKRRLVNWGMQEQFSEQNGFWL